MNNARLTREQRRESRELHPGRVFELRSASKRHPAPCALIVDPTAYSRAAVAVDTVGVIGEGLYCRHRPNVYIEGMRASEITKRIVRRRPELERFDRDDLDLLKWGCALDFNGRIHGSVHDQSIAPVAPGEWAVFWLPAEGKGDYWWFHRPHREIEAIFAGAWYFQNHGGARHLGYRFGALWATKHTGVRLEQIRQYLRALRPDIIEQWARVIRHQEGDSIITRVVHRESPALGRGTAWVRSASGRDGYITCGG